MTTTKSATVPMMSQKTVDTDTAAAPSSKPCIDSLRYVNLTECDREEFAAFYLENQYANPNFRALGASNDDIRTYGRSIYDISALPPCLGMVCITDTGKVIGCHLAVSSDHLQHLDEEKLGKVAAHAALVKHFSQKMLDEWHLAGTETLVHCIYVGILESHRGTGIYGRLGDGTLQLQMEHNCQWTWSYTTNAVILMKGLLGKSGTSSSIASVNTNWLFGAILENIMPTLVTSPEWMLSFVKDTIVYFGYMPKNQPVQVCKLNSFMYNGEQPFKTNHVCCVGVYKSTPSKKSKGLKMQ